MDEYAVGEHSMYTFGRSLTCDFQLEHPSASRQHAVLVHHENGGLYIIDLKVPPPSPHLLLTPAPVPFPDTLTGARLAPVPAQVRTPKRQP